MRKNIIDFSNSEIINEFMDKEKQRVTDIQTISKFNSHCLYISFTGKLNFTLKYIVVI
jgi:hypothetical protein